MNRCITADAATVTPRQFIDALCLSSPEKRAADRAAMLESCIRAVRRNETYGWPPMMQDEARRIIAERDGADWTVTVRDHGNGHASVAA
jgi:hypothetical protein